MKKILLSALVQVAFFSLHAQTANTAYGSGALVNNVNGKYHTAIGDGALLTQRGGEFNTAVGASAQAYSVTAAGRSGGSYNTSIGGLSLYNNYGFYNTGNGYRSMYTCAGGSWNSADGAFSLYYNTSGHLNTANGYYTLYSNTTGGFNTAEGAFALSLNSTGEYNVAIGYNAGPHLDGLYNTTSIGNGAIATASNHVRIGNNDVTEISGRVPYAAISDGRFKRDIKEDISGLDFIINLRPVSYTVDNNALDKFLGVPDSVLAKKSSVRKTPEREIGFVAQEVEQLVKKSGYAFNGVRAPQNEKSHYSLAYSQFVVPLVKAVQELNAIVKEQQEQIELLLNERNDKADLKGHETPGVLSLLQNSPNPFTVDTEINMNLPESAGQVRLMIYALDGKEIKSLPVSDRGKVTVKISARELSAGMYFYTLLVDNKVIDTKRMILTQ